MKLSRTNVDWNRFDKAAKIGLTQTARPKADKSAVSEIPKHYPKEVSVLVERGWRGQGISPFLAPVLH